MNLIPVNDLSDEALDIYARCKEAQLLHYFEPNGGIFLAETPVVLERALAAGYEPLSFLVEERELEDICPLIERYASFGTPIYTAPHEVLVRLTGYELTRGVLGALKRREMTSLRAVAGSCSRIAVLENVMNPANVGAIFRSAAALGMDGVILTQGAADPLYRRAIRVSMGTVFDLPWTIVRDDISWIEALKQQEFCLVSMALTEKTVPLGSTAFSRQDKLAVIFGTESTGIREETLDRSDYIIKIPMQRGVDSLNVAAASAVAFWEINRGMEKQKK